MHNSKFMKKSIFLFTILSFITINCNAQSLSDLLNKDNISKAASAVTGKSNLNIVGKWVFDGSAVEMKSSNVIKNAGGKLATATIEDKLDKQFGKLGMQKGTATFNFEADSTFTVTLKNKTQKGKYSIDKSNSRLDLTFLGKATVSGEIAVSNKQMTLTFEADKLVSVVSYICQMSNSSSLKSLNSLLGSFDDIRTGFTLIKQ